MAPASKSDVYRAIARALDALAEIEEREARQAPPAPAGDVWTSRNLPPDIKTRERFNRLAKGVHGARRQGATWVVDRTAWQEARTRRKGKAAPAPAPVLDEADELAARSLVAMGFRPRAA
jgi:hypothetical protein